jgi:hypothetical protein
MPAQIFVFPLDRRVGYVRDKAAKLLIRRDRADADRYIEDVLAYSRGSLARFGCIPPEKVERELHGLRAAVMAESWRILMETREASAERA